MAAEPPEYHSITIGTTALPITTTAFTSTPTAGDLIIATAPPTAATTTTMAAAFPTQPNNPGPPLARKRQRRPSVRLGEIGDQPAASLSLDSHVRTKNPPAPSSFSSWHQNQSWSTKEQSKSVRNRSLTNLVNGSDYYEEDNNGDNSNQIQNYPQQSRKALKSKRVSATTAAKRVRSNWVGEAAAKSDSREDEGFRDFDQDSDSPLLKEDQSPVHSADVELELRHNRHPNIYTIEMDNDSKCEGVRTWLIELGLSRYAPVFEIHEVDDEVLPMLTLEDLKDMGINAVGSRRKLYAAIQKLRHKGFS